MHYTGTPHKRTVQQNKALHKFCEEVANELNSQGITVQKFLDHTVELDWNKDTVKNLIWKPIQKALTDKGSTTELDKVNDIGLIWEHINRHLSITFGISVEWPHKDPNDIAPLK